MYLKNKYEKNRRIVTTFGGVLRQRILNIRKYIHGYIYIFNSFTSNESHHNRRTYLLPDLMYIQITQPNPPPHQFPLPSFPLLPSPSISNSPK